MLKCSKQEKIWIIFCIFLITIFFVLPQNSLAASLTNLSDKMSRQAPSTASNHEIKFSTPSGLGNSGEYLRIIFDSDFNLAAITFADIDLWHGPTTGLETTETLGALANATNWGVTISGSQIDFTHPTNNANGDILSNDKVAVRIGLNAVGGTQQIINPGTIGSKIITISGNYGDAGKLAVAIYQDQVGVGGQTTLAPPNPVILDPPYNITTSAMDLHWSQNIDLDFQRYELYRSISPGVTNLTGILIVTYFNNTETSFSQTGLISNTTYYYVVYVYDTEGLSAISNEVNGKTLVISHPPSIPPRPAMPTIDQGICPIFLPAIILTGTKPSNTIVFINNSTDNVNYPAALNWSSLENLIMGNNLFLIYSRDNYGQNSDILNAVIRRCRIGDTNCSTIVDDFDLAGLAYHWETDWCYGDFNHDFIDDDFDLAGLASHWDGIY